MTTVYLARHGESDWNVERRWQGHADRPLTERGREQARALAERLAEVDVGSWSGFTRDECAERFPDAFTQWQEGGTGWEDGESYEEMGERMVAAIERLAAAHPEGAILVVSHGGPIRAVHAHALGVDIATHRRTGPVEPNARLSAVSVQNGRIARLE